MYDYHNINFKALVYTKSFFNKQLVIYWAWKLVLIYILLKNKDWLFGIKFKGDSHNLAQNCMINISVLYIIISQFSH